MPILLLLFFKIHSYETPLIHFIISGSLNGTAAFVNLDNIPENIDYIYFSFDFDFHSKVSKNPNIAFFIIDSLIDYSQENSVNEKVEYGFVEKTWTEMKNYEDLNYVKKWKKIDFLYKYNDSNSNMKYCEAERISDKMKTLILRVPTYGKREGYIMVSNILNLPNLKE